MGAIRNRSSRFTWRVIKCQSTETGREEEILQTEERGADGELSGDF